MSKTTRPETEASITCGFYNSLNDRKYHSHNFSDLIDSLINDGVFMSKGSAFVVNASTGNTVNVGTGKCWFNSTWTENDAILPVDCGAPEVLLNRIDAVVIEVNKTEAIRDNYINIVRGTAASSPVRPTLTNTEQVHQHALCYIYRQAGSTAIRQADITNVVGTDETPFVTGILQTISINSLLGQWQDELDRFVANEEADIDAFMTGQEQDFTAWFASMRTLMSDAISEQNAWTAAQKATILEWFDTMKDQLSEDVAINLQFQINDNEIKRMLMIGLTDGTKTISTDGSVITSVDSSGRTLTKTYTNNFLTCTSVLRDHNGSLIGQMVKNFSEDGDVINTTVSWSDEYTSDIQNMVNAQLEDIENGSY